MIPTNWSKINITQYEAIEDIMREPIKDDLDKIQRYIDVLEIITGKEQDEIRELPVEKLLRVQDLLNTDIPKKLPEWIKLKDNYYKVIQNPTKENADRYMMVMNAVKSNKTNEVLFSVCKPYNKILGKEIKLSPEENAERIEHFRELPVTLAMPIKVFFCNLYTELTNVILKYSDQILETQKKLVEQQISSLENLDG